jgi:hypothetical protein
LIPARLYDKKIEGAGAQALNGACFAPRDFVFVDVMTKAIGEVDNQTAGMLRDLQTMHDSGAAENPRRFWCDGLKSIARSRGIKMSAKLSRRIAAIKAAHTRKDKVAQ